MGDPILARSWPSDAGADREVLAGIVVSRGELGRVGEQPERNGLRRLVAFMAFYARDVLSGALPGPYSDPPPERFARLALTTPTS